MTTALPTTIAAVSFPVPMLNPEAFYRAKVGGILTPGVIPPAGVEGWALVFGWDVKKGKGANDATITDKGDEPPKGKIKYQVWRYGQNGDPDDFADDDAFVRMLISAKANHQALDLSHPIINQLTVSAVVPAEIGQLTDEGRGLWTRTIEFLKWVPQPIASSGTPSGSNDKDPNDPNAQGTDPQPNNPNADREKEFTDKLNEASQ